MNEFTRKTTANLRKRFPFLYPEPDVPFDKAKIVAKLDLMMLDGWKALEDLTIEELNELQAAAESAVMETDDYGFALDYNDHHKTIFEAREAIKAQRWKLQQEKTEKYLEQSKRRGMISGAANLIIEAINLIEEAYKIEPSPFAWNPMLPSQCEAIDPSTMTVADLNAVIRETNSDKTRMPLPDYSMIAMLKTPAAKAIAEELKEQDEVYRKRIEVSQSNRMAARVELSQREKKDAETATLNKEINENINDVVAELRNRIAELEAGK